jgi:nucleoside-diphosphate-sugar epimerase
MKVFVTGATGFIGARTVEIYSERYGPESVTASYPPPANAVERERVERIKALGVKTLVWDLLEPLHDKITVPPFDAVLHLGAFTTTEIKSDVIRVNDVGTRNLIESLSGHLRGKIFLFTSTQMVVDKANPSASIVNEDSPCAPRTEYGRTKLRAEKIVREYAGKMGVSYTILRPPTVYGPGFRDAGMFGLFARWAKRSFSPADIDWTGVMSLLYLDDMVEAMIRLLESTDPRARNSTFFISSPEKTTMGEIARGIAEANGSEVRSISIPRWLEKVLEVLVWQNWLWRHGPHIIHIMTWRLSLIISDGYYGDASRLQEVLPGFTYLTFREGVKRTYGAEDSSG